MPLLPAFPPAQEGRDAGGQWADWKRTVVIASADRQDVVQCRVARPEAEEGPKFRRRVIG